MSNEGKSASPNYTFVGRCEMEKFGSIRIGYTKKDLQKLEANIGPNGWGNTRIKFKQQDNSPFMVLVEPKDKRAEPDREPVPTERTAEIPVEAPEDVPKKRIPF